MMLNSTKYISIGFWRSHLLTQIYVMTSSVIFSSEEDPQIFLLKWTFHGSYKLVEKLRVGRGGLLHWVELSDLGSSDFQPLY